jgi:hypothetical protein
VLAVEFCLPVARDSLELDVSGGLGEVEEASDVGAASELLSRSLPPAAVA